MENPVQQIQDPTIVQRRVQQTRKCVGARKLLSGAEPKTSARRSQKLMMVLIAHLQLHVTNHASRRKYCAMEGRTQPGAKTLTYVFQETEITTGICVLSNVQNFAQ